MIGHNKLKSFDILFFLYSLINIVLIFIGRDGIKNSDTHIGVFTTVMVFVALLIRYHDKYNGKILSFLRYWYPYIMFGYFFEITTIANKVFFSDFIDSFFIRIDQWIFGYQPVIEWGLRFENNLIIQEILYFSYFTYYLLFPGVGIFVYLKQREFFSKYTFTVVFSFYACYLTYLVLPVVGGRYLPELAEIAVTFKGGLFRRIMAFIYTHSNHFGSAFPSSHVALAITANIAVWHYFGRIGYYLIPIPVLIIVATVFCHYHYFIDAVFGVIYGVGLYYPAVKLYDKLELYLNRETANLIKNQLRKPERGAV